MASIADDEAASIKIPAIAKIPKHQRLSFADENESVNTYRANKDPETDRCKAMALATKQAGLREEVAKAMLSACAPPKRSPKMGGPLASRSSNSGRSPCTPQDGPGEKLGFGSSAPRSKRDSLPAPPPASARSKNRCETPEPASRVGMVRSPMDKRSQKVLPQRPQGPPPTRQQPPPSPRGNSMWPPSPQSGRRQSPSFMLKPGPPRCPSHASLSSGITRQASAGRCPSISRSNSYMQMPEGPQVHTARARTHTHGSSQHLMQSATNLRPSPSQGSLSYAAPTQTNSFVPQPASPMSRTNSYVPPLHSSSYNVPVSSPMVTAAPQAELEPQYPNSVERVRDL